MKGYQSLRAAVEKDCNQSCGCFNPEGCDKPNASHNGKRCSHKYCDRFAWAVNQAKHYSEKTGIAWETVLERWEAERDYWYMNYYQEAKVPRLDAEHVRVFETLADLLTSVGKSEFRCPACGGVSSNPYECNSGIKKDGKPCNWKVYGLFRDLGKGAFVFCKEQMQGNLIFMPLAWEPDGSNNLHEGE